METTENRITLDTLQQILYNTGNYTKHTEPCIFKYGRKGTISGFFDPALCCVETHSYWRPGNRKGLHLILCYRGNTPDPACISHTCTFNQKMLEAIQADPSAISVTAETCALHWRTHKGDLAALKRFLKRALYTDDACTQRTADGEQLRELTDKLMQSENPAQILTILLFFSVLNSNIHALTQLYDWDAIARDYPLTPAPMAPNRDSIVEIVPCTLIAPLPILKNDSVGRTDALHAVYHQFYDEKRRHVYLCGFGGIGKTEIAIRFGEAQIRQTPGLCCFHHVFFTRFSESIRTTILRLEFSSYDTPNALLSLGEDAVYAAKLQLLRKYNEKTLLIIDNFDLPNKSYDFLRREAGGFADLEALNICVLFTTRYPLQTGIAVKSLPEAEELALFRQFCHRPVPDDLLLQIARAVSGHTLTIQLLAKTLERSPITPSELLESIRSHQLSDPRLRPVYSERVLSSNTDSQTKATIANHIRYLFDLSVLSEQEREAFACALLSPDSGMPMSLWREYARTDSARFDALMNLVDFGLVDYLPEQDLLSVHMLIREIGNADPQLRPTPALALPFLDSVWADYTAHDAQDGAACAVKAEEIFACALACSWDWADAQLQPVIDRAIALRHTIGSYQKELELLLERQSILPSSDAEYYQISRAYDERGDYENALRYIDMALAALDDAAADAALRRAKYLTLKGYIYGDMGDSVDPRYYDADLDCKLAAKEIYDRQQDISFDRILNLHYIAYTRIHLDKQKAREEEECALSWLARLPQEPQVELLRASVLGQYGSVLDALGEFSEAWKQKEKSLAICKRLLPPLHPELAKAYNNCAITLFHMDNRDALLYAEQSLRIREVILDETHPDYQNTVQYYKKIRERFSGDTAAR